MGVTSSWISISLIFAIFRASNYKTNNETDYPRSEGCRLFAKFELESEGWKFIRYKDFIPKREALLRNRGVQTNGYREGIPERLGGSI